jgi:hypothetical protein
LLIPFRDKQKERSRQTKLSVYRETGEWPGRKRASTADANKMAWSQKVNQKERKRKRKEAKEKKRQNPEENVEPGNNSDDDDLADDYRLIKKMRKGKVRRKALFF